MAGRAVLFALAENDTERLLTAAGDDEVMEIIEAIEGKWDEHWLCELDKSWDALHRCLTDGELEFKNGAYPLNHAILGGEQLYEGDDYIVTLVRPEQVVDVAQALESITEAELRVRYFRIDPNKYGGSPAQLDEEDFRYTAENLEELKRFYARAAVANRAVIFTVGQ